MTRPTVKRPYFTKYQLEIDTENTEYYAERPDTYPGINELYTLLKLAGGKYFYIDPMDSEYWISELLEKGKFINPVVVSHDISRKCRLKPMKCYASLLETMYPWRKPNGYTDIYIGYSLLSVDDLWMQHTWMYDGTVIYESTPIRSSKYFAMKTTYEQLKAWNDNHRWNGSFNAEGDKITFEEW